MLKTETPFPHVGSFALLIDTNLPEEQQRAELVRIIGYTPDDVQSAVRIAFPLRLGASGTKIVAFDELIDATPLAKSEERELTDLQRGLAQQVRPNRKKVERAEALRKRLLFSDLLRAEKAKLARLDARAQPSIGRRLPRGEVAERRFA